MAIAGGARLRAPPLRLEEPVHALFRERSTRLPAIERNPNYADPYFGRGNVRQARGDLDGAPADYEMMIRLRPHDPMGYVNRGAVRHLKGELETAAADYRRALELASQDWVFRDIALDNLAQINSGYGAGEPGVAEAR